MTSQRPPASPSTRAVARLVPRLRPIGSGTPPGVGKPPLLADLRRNRGLEPDFNPFSVALRMLETDQASGRSRGPVAPAGDAA